MLGSTADTLAREDLKKFCLHWEMTNIESSTVARRPQQIFSDRVLRVET